MIAKKGKQPHSHTEPTENELDRAVLCGPLAAKGRRLGSILSGSCSSPSCPLFKRPTDRFGSKAIPLDPCNQLHAMAGVHLWMTFDNWELSEQLALVLEGLPERALE